MDPLLEQLWKNAILVGAEKRVPPVALMEAFLKLTTEYGSIEDVPSDAITKIGEDLVVEWGASVFLEQEHA